MVQDFKLFTYGSKTKHLEIHTFSNYKIDPTLMVLQYSVALKIDFFDKKGALLLKAFFCGLERW